MKRVHLSFIYIINAFLLFLSSTHASAQNYTQFVDPLIGSGGHGHVFVGASVPFGAVQLGPNNIFKGWDWCSGYHASDSILIGFSHTHLSGTGMPDLGDVLIMPYTGAVKLNKGTQENPSSGYASHYTHADEIAKPGFYAVKLDDYNIDVKLTATERVGFHQYHFSRGANAHVIIDLKEGIGDKATDTYIEQTDDYTIKGYRFSTGWAADQRLFFAIKSSLPLKQFAVYDSSALLLGKKGKGLAIKGLISFDKAPEQLMLKVGISSVSADNALANITAEIQGWDFDKTAKAADEKWNKELSKIKIETRSDTAKKIFYTALYHTMIDPALFNDHNKDYRGADKKIYTKAAFNNYTVFSLWDTYRALNPLYTIIQPERTNDIVNSMLHIYQQQGKLPIWHLNGNETNLMPGISGVQIVCEAYLKGFTGFDKQLAFEAVKASAIRNEKGLKWDKALHYIPSDSVEESLAKALEYSVSNASIASMAKKMNSFKDYDYYQQRFHNYRQYFDSSTGFFRGRLANGNWNPVFNPSKSSHPWIDDLSEGNHWQYLWLVPGDVEGLMQLLGGEEKFITRLDSLFTIQEAPDPNAPPDIAGLIGQYAHGDEPGHHTIYLYPYAGQQWKTADKARYILNNMYHDNADGLSGNEDCGQMSAWYIFSSLGFYPVFPANGAYVLGSPLFDKTTIDVGNGKTFTVEAANNSSENMYIQKIELNGKPYTKSYLMHEDIMRGGVLKITMGKVPNKEFGSKMEDRPKSVY